ncbi:MAG: hypothetical protein LBC95_03065 [Candidatus Nomurabacteria bacterium]|jgi:hypothetical protein|nr:hypothetical protein [Candidatus Nomurabacteria bacterium]
MVTVIVIVMLGALFGLALISGRRFGLLGLGLAAGTLLAGQTAVPLENIFMLFKQYLGGISPAQGAALLLVLAPSLLLMLTGSKYHGMKGRLFGSLLYTVMAAAALLPFVIHSIDVPADVKNVIMTTHTAVIIGGIVGAVIDCLVTRNHKKV